MAKTFKLLFTFGVILAISFTASAYDFHVGQFYYKYNSDGTVTITRSTYDVPVDVYHGHITIPSSVEYDGIKYTVTAIDVAVFENQDHLVSVIIPNSIITIGGVLLDVAH